MRHAGRSRGSCDHLGQEPEDVYWDFVYAPLQDANGAIEGVLVSGFEVTAQVRASHDSLDSSTRAEAGERQLRQFVENLPGSGVDGPA